MRRSSSASSGAKGTVSGTVTSGATWIEEFELSQNDLEITDADTSTWKFLFKHCDSGSAALTLTSGTEITVTQNTTSTLFAIEVDVTGMSGDYQADLAQQTPSGQIIHWASGIVTFVEEELGF